MGQETAWSPGRNEYPSARAQDSDRSGCNFGVGVDAGSTIVVAPGRRSRHILSKGCEPRTAEHALIPTDPDVPAVAMTPSRAHR